MNKGPILVIMAAGMGSRYGGLKQMDPVGACGEVILHYSIYDAMRAGFRRVVFIIKHAIEADFREKVGDPVSHCMEVGYAFQEVDAIPAPFSVPDGRSKPWGTGHAVLCARELLDAPFAVINADDYYGIDAFQAAYDYLKDAKDDDKERWMMVGYQLKNTVSEHGHVARGVCTVAEDGTLAGIRETTHIITSSDGPLYTEDGETYRKLSPDTQVSMNMWGFTPSFLQELQQGFEPFLCKAMTENPLKAEYFLPSVVSTALTEGRATVQVLSSKDKWYGVTYREDRPEVVAAMKDMTEAGLYPKPLF